MRLYTEDFNYQALEAKKSSLKQQLSNSYFHHRKPVGAKANPPRQSS